VAKFGRIDYACNIAGILMYGTTTEFSAANFDTQWNINGRGTWLCQRAELTQMAKQDPIRGEEDLYYQRGSIVNMSSMAGLRGYEMLPSYCATKHAINGFTKSDALRVASDGIRINAVCPGVIKTSLLKETEEGDQSSMDLLVSETHMKRLGHPEEVAEAVLFLTSGKSSFITATTLSVNGGEFCFRGTRSTAHTNHIFRYDRVVNTVSLDTFGSNLNHSCP
jgi:NAD(P)-dependent dehydrogenase (short-subunit alcohol dehydrogenase family)